MKTRFEPDDETVHDLSLHGATADDRFLPTLIEPEAYDASEQTFAMDKPPRFVVEEATSEGPAEAEPKDQLHENLEEIRRYDSQVPAILTPLALDVQAGDSEPWRREVAARLSQYRSRRRPREPRYPSLQLSFETDPALSEPRSEGSTREATNFAALVPASPVGLDRSLPSIANASRWGQGSQPSNVPRIRLAEPAANPRVVFSASNEATAKVIDFASYSPAARPFDELAEPVFDRPRIIEAPDLVPPLPALGGILIEPADKPDNERRPGFEIPLLAAPMGRRMAAAAVDAVMVMSAIAGFAYIFFRITGETPSPAKVAWTASFMAGAFWSAYQYLLLVYSGTTPGLKLAQLELQRFDGERVPRRTRRWRVLASMLSAVSLGLGYAWCLLDEDELCWHDRITTTYMAPRK